MSRLEEYNGHYTYTLKTPWRNGATHVTFDEKSLLQRLVALIPPPRANLIRFHGVFAPNFKDRKKIVPQDLTETTESGSQSPKKRILWAELIRRTFAIDVTICSKCQGRIEPIAVIKDEKVIFAILESLGERSTFLVAAPTRGPPSQQAFENFSANIPESCDQRPTDW